MNLYEYTKNKLLFFIKKASLSGCPYIELFKFNEYSRQFFQQKSLRYMHQHV